MRKNSCERKISISLICMQSVFPSTVCMWLSYAERTEGLGDAQGRYAFYWGILASELCNFEYSGDETKKL